MGVFLFFMIRFGAIHRLIENAKNLSADAVWIEAIDNDVQDEIIRLNTQEQLFDQGIDSQGRSLGDYSNVSVEIYGKPAGHIRLYDTGHYYDSHKVIVDKTGFNITADDVSIYDEPLTQVWGEDIIGLTEENLNSLKEWILDNYLIYVKRELLR